MKRSDEDNFVRDLLVSNRAITLADIIELWKRGYHVELTPLNQVFRVVVHHGARMESRSIPMIEVESSHLSVLDAVIRRLLRDIRQLHPRTVESTEVTRG